MPARSTGELAFYSYDPHAADEANIRSLQRKLRFVERVAKAGLADLRVAVRTTSAMPRDFPADHPNHLMFVASLKTAALKAALAAWMERSFAYALHGLNDRPAVDPERYLDETVSMVTSFAELLRQELRAVGAAKRAASLRLKSAT